MSSSGIARLFYLFFSDFVQSYVTQDIYAYNSCYNLDYVCITIKGHNVLPYSTAIIFIAPKDVKLQRDVILNKYPSER